jgi:hypothetical protein
MSKGGSRYGAGRPGWHTKAEHCRRIDINRIAGAGLLAPGSYGWQWTDKETGRVLASIGIEGGAERIDLSFAVDGVPVVQTVHIDRTACHFGKSRPWFKCPQCWGRVAILFLKHRRFACRKCHKLAYASQSEDTIGRAWRKQQRLEALLGPDWHRPKGMHRATHSRVLEGIWACEGARDDALAAYCARLGFDVLAKAVNPE